MRFGFEMDKVTYAGSFDSFEDNYDEALWNEIEEYLNAYESKPVDVRDLINFVEEVANTSYKGFEISSYMYYKSNNNPDHYLDFQLNFTNGFYISVKPYYGIEGR